MNTGDDETRRYFKNSCVKVLLCPRSAGKGSWAKKQVALYTCLIQNQSGIMCCLSLGNRNNLHSPPEECDRRRGRG